jgi:hypothetical protein
MGVPLPSSSRSFTYFVGATPAPTPVPPPAAPSPVPTPPANGSPTAEPAPAVDGELPMAEVSDTRVGVNFEVTRRLGRHMLSGQISTSREEDYTSLGVSLRDGVEFNARATTLLLGTAFTHDWIRAGAVDEAKDTLDLMLGVTHILTPKSVGTANVSWSHIEGYLSDPYKVVELNGALAAENRPGEKDRFALYLSFLRYLESLDASVELAYRWYADTYGVGAHTASVQWHQRLSPKFVLRPSLRYYQQTAADFYAARFEGAPEHYSSDYRLSALNAIGYGLKAVWTPNARFAADLSLERYEQHGLDNETDSEMFPSATIVTGGIRLWL